MKKYFYLALIAIACGAMFTACDKTKGNVDGPDNPDDSSKGACYKITQGDPGQTYTYYTWMEDAVQEKLQLSKQIAEEQGMVFEYEKAAANDEDACLALNNPGGGQTGGDETFACYKITNGSTTQYLWTSENILKNLYGSNDFVVWEKAAANDEDACTALNGSASCWKLTVTINGQSSTSYMWMTESQIEAAADAYRQMYTNATVTVEPASANDENSCYNLNNQ